MKLKWWSLGFHGLHRNLNKSLMGKNFVTIPMSHLWEWLGCLQWAESGRTIPLEHCRCDFTLWVWQSLGGKTLNQPTPCTMYGKTHQMFYSGTSWSSQLWLKSCIFGGSLDRFPGTLNPRLPSEAQFMHFCGKFTNTGSGYKLPKVLTLKSVHAFNARHIWSSQNS